MKTEWIDIVDINGHPTGKRIVRGTKLLPGEFVRASIICIVNRKGQMLIQKRHRDKEYWPGLWDISAGGAVSAGETPQECAQREVGEELGITLDLHDTRPCLITTYSSGFTVTFVVTRDVDLKDVVLQKEEVEDARYASKEEIMKMMEEGSFIKYRKAWIDYIFEAASVGFVF